MIARKIIKACRNKAGLSQQAFADKTGINVSTLRGWERGQYIPSSEALISALKVADKKLYDKIVKIVNTG